MSAVLAGHTGCVNRLAWNQDGSMLASASDDCQVRRRVPVQSSSTGWWGLVLTVQMRGYPEHPGVILAHEQ